LKVKQVAFKKQLQKGEKFLFLLGKITNLTLTRVATPSCS
jgi:hypothetical protein